MMVSALVLGVLPAQVASPKVTFKEGVFTVTGALGTDIVPVKTAPAQADASVPASGKFLVTVGETSVIFDAKGLTIKTPKSFKTTRLDAVPTSGKIATKQSNAELMKLVSAKQRRLEVEALSGWELTGETLYLLTRWEDKSKRPWLETLVKIDLREVRPEPRLLGKLDARSYAQGRVDDVLTAKEGNLVVLAERQGRFGVVTFSKTGKSEFGPLGEPVGKARLCEDGCTAWTVTPTTYGTNILGLADLGAGDSRPVAEIRGKMKGFVNPGYARYESADGPRVLNLRSGAEMDLSLDAEGKHTAHGLLVWSPADEPKTAVLYDSSFRRLAFWNGTPTTAQTVAPPVKRLAVAATKAKVPPKGGAKPGAKPNPEPKSRKLTKRTTTAAVKPKAPTKATSSKANEPSSKRRLVSQTKSKPNRTRTLPKTQVRPRIVVTARPVASGQG